MPALTLGQYEEIEYQLTPSEQIHPKARTYLDIERLESTNRILLKTREYIGFLPVTDQTYLIVQPKGEIEDLFHMVSLSGKSERKILERIGTDWKISDYSDLLSFMAHDFISGLSQVERFGFWKRYEDKYHTLPLVRGKIDIGQTIRGPWMHGFSHMLVSQVAEPELDIAPNRIIRACIISLLKTKGLTREDRRKLHRLERIFRRIPLKNTKRDLHEVVSLISSKRGIPSSRLYYRDLLSISLFVLENSSCSLMEEGPVELNAFAINMDQVFEGYVRNLIAEELSVDGFSVKDGNQGNHFLFNNSSDYRIQPDLLIEKAGKVVLVADSKYTKGMPSKDDMAQIISYIAAFGLNTGILICPMTSKNPGRIVFKTPLCEVIVHPMNLGEMDTGEELLISEVRDILTT